MLVLSLFPREVLGRYLSHFKPVPEEADELVREAYVALPRDLANNPATYRRSQRWQNIQAPNSHFKEQHCQRTWTIGFS
jgi:hypothetical protein